MNLRLDQDIRLRFSEREAVEIEKGECLKQAFTLMEGFAFQVTAQLAETSGFFRDSENQVRIQISRSDFAKLRTEDKKQGLEIGPWTVQIDLMRRRKSEYGDK